MHRVIACLATAVLLPAARDLAPLPLELPKPRFEVTPQNLQLPNLDEPRKGPRPPFLALSGTENLARSKRVSGSGADPVFGELSFVTDGEQSAPMGPALNCRRVHRTLNSISGSAARSLRCCSGTITSNPGL